ncbi:MAG TPA: tRNA lysidine(34) synthetase TilS [Pyrinomonadaceae bacterium]|nr:tRNA lysidine(34) synthetase TilS [Pyrinomonadaceae bacterium]
MRRTPRVNQFARLLLVEWRKLKLPLSDETLIVGVSGGADSTALLLALNELANAGKFSPKICVAHLDHKLRKTSGEDARWVETLAAKLGYESVIGRSKVAEIARTRNENLEQAARDARYAFLARTAKRKSAKYVLTAHTMDDQAETVLLRLMRGSAGAGLGGMEAMRPLSGTTSLQLVRPLLWARRTDTENYCRLRKHKFLVDEMNSDLGLSRVRVRQQLLPLMQSFNNRIVEALSRTAAQLREDRAVLLTDSDELLQRASLSADENHETEVPALDVKVLAEEPPALRRRALRQWLSQARGSARRLEMVHLMAVDRLVEGAAGGRTVELPGGSKVKRSKNRLEFQPEKD